MRPISRMQIRTRDRQEAISVISRIYCAHEMGLPGPYSGLATCLDVTHGGVQPIVHLKHSTPVRIDAGSFPSLMLMQTCVDGGGSVTQGDATAVCRVGETLPLSPGVDTRTQFDGRFAQRTVRLDVERAEALVALWLGHPLDRSLRFELLPFSASLEQAWTQAVDLLLDYERQNFALPDAAVASFDEFMLSLVLRLHPHNYSEEVRDARTHASPRVVRQAEYWMRNGEAGMSVSAIAARIGVSLRTLEVAFREYRHSTPTRYLRNVRLDAVRSRLLDPNPGTTVTSAALDNGFFHLPRFSAYYKAAFHELPGQTLRRTRRRNAFTNIQP
jgi:AraC-like DNA-binding protein